METLVDEQRWLRAERKSRTSADKRSAKNRSEQLSEGMEMEQLYLSRAYGEIHEIGFGEAYEITHCQEREGRL